MQNWYRSQVCSGIDKKLIGGSSQVWMFFKIHILVKNETKILPQLRFAHS